MIEWKYRNGGVIRCIEENRVLNESISEVKQAIIEALDVAYLINCQEDDVRAVLTELVLSLSSSYERRSNPR